MARFAARSMIFRPRTDELAPRASVRTHVYQNPVVESGLDTTLRGQGRERQREREERDKRRERGRRQFEGEIEKARSLPR